MAPETMKLNVGISSNGDVDIGEVSLADMDPEDIRVTEFKIFFSFFCLFTQVSIKDPTLVVIHMKLLNSPKASLKNFI